jgi:hypothetical protein
MTEYPFWFPAPRKNRNADYRLPWHASTEQQLGRSTDWHRDCFVSGDSPQAAQRFLFSGYFRQILSTLTRNGRDPARLWDAEDGIVRSVHQQILMAIMKTSVRRKLEPQRPEPQEPKSPPAPLESLEDIAWELWLLIELLAPVRRRLPNTASQKLVDYVKDRLIAKSVALAKWKKARPELFPDSPIGARDVLPGENWIFPEHRTLADVIEAERTSTRVFSKAS